MKMDGKNGLSARQLAVASFTGLLSPAAAAAGLDWRGALLAVPVAVCAAWCWNRLGRDFGWVNRWNGFLGRSAAVLYLIWMTVFAGAALNWASVRVAAPGGDGNYQIWICLLIWLCLLWMARGTPGAFCRAAEIFYLAMGAALVLVLVFGGMQVHGDWLLEDGADLRRSFLVCAGLGCSGVVSLFLWDGEGQTGEKQRWLPWSGVFGVVLALMCAVTVGSLSPALAQMQARPFFVMAVGLGESARMEGLVGMVWLMADLTFMGWMVQAGRRLWRVIGLPWEKGAPWVLSLLILGCGFLDTAGLFQGLLPVLGLIAGGIFPVIGCFAQRERKK